MTVHLPELNCLLILAYIGTAAEERRKNPPRKVVTILYNKDKHFYSTNPVTPKLLPDQPQNDVLSHYAVIFQGRLLIGLPLHVHAFTNYIVTCIQIQSLLEYPTCSLVTKVCVNISADEAAVKKLVLSIIVG